MNHYSELLYYIKGLAEADPFINHVTQGEFAEADVDKMVLPIVLNIEINSGTLPDNIVTFDVELACMSQRDINKEVRTDDFAKQDNEIDNFNETHAVLNRIFNKMRLDFEKSNITATENPSINKITFGTSKLLDGWLLTFTVEMPNTTINLCQ